MFTRGLALCLMLAVASVAQAGAVIDLVPNNAAVPDGGSVIVEIYLTQTGGPNPLLSRMVQLDFSASDPGLVLSAPGSSGTIVEMFDFASATDCPGSCGTAHVIDAEFPVVSAAYGDASHLGADGTVQMNLGVGVQTKIGEIEVSCAGGGVLTVDALNAADLGTDAGARLFFGFGVNVDGTPITTWKAADGDITGGLGTYSCEAPPTCNLIDASTDCDGSLWRTANNVVELTFDGPADNCIPTVHELLAGGALGPDMSADFDVTVNGNVVRVEEIGDSASLVHGMWIGLIHPDYQRHYQVVIGDASGDRRVLSFDVSVINSGIPCINCPDDRRDINGDSRILSFDVSITNGYIPYIGAAKPVGHTCIP